MRRKPSRLRRTLAIRRQANGMYARFFLPPLTYSLPSRANDITSKAPKVKAEPPQDPEVLSETLSEIEQHEWNL